MQLIKSIIEEKMKLHEDFMLRRYYLRAFSHFYSCFSLALAVLGEKPEEDKARKIRRLWRRLLTDDKINKKYLERMRMYIDEDKKQIIKAQKMMEEEIESSDYYQSKLDEKGAIMILGQLYPGD